MLESFLIRSGSGHTALADSQLNKLLSKVVANQAAAVASKSNGTSNSNLNLNVKSCSSMRDSSRNQAEQQEQPFSFTVCEQFKRKIQSLKDENSHYLKSLIYVYRSFRHLKAQPKYLKQMFGEDLMVKFENEEENEKDKEGANLLENIFGNVTFKFEQAKQEIAERDQQIAGLEAKLLVLQNNINTMTAAPAPIIGEPRNSNVDYPYASTSEQEFNKLREVFIKNNLLLGEMKQQADSSNSKKNLQTIKSTLEKNQCELGELLKTFWVSDSLASPVILSQNKELKAKVKKYKEEVHRLKEKIRVQHEDIKEALDQLMRINKEKEDKKFDLIANATATAAAVATLNSNNSGSNNLNCKNETNIGRRHSYLKNKKLIDHSTVAITGDYESQITNEYLTEKLTKTHSQLKRARSIIQHKLDRANKDQQQTEF